VHAYSQSSIGPAFMGFFIFLLLLSIGTLALRWKDLRPKTNSPAYLTPAGLTRTLALCGTLLVLVCLFGVTLPLTTQAFTGQSIEPSELYYEWSFSPLLIIIFISMALGYLPAKKNLHTFSILGGMVLAVLTGLLFKKMTFFGLIGLWLVFFAISALIITAVYRFSRSAPQNKSKRKSAMLAGILLHLGFVLLALGVVGSHSISDSTIVSLLTGQSTALGSWQITKTAAGVEVAADEQVLYAEEYVFQKDGSQEVVLQPHILWYSDTGSTVSAPAIRSNLASDTYTAILEWDGFSNGTTTVLLSHYPLMAWLWIGGVLLMLGTLWLHFSTPFLKEDGELQE
jgi:cytochrome c-type biogenesis protein CcmF